MCALKACASAASSRPASNGDPRLMLRAGVSVCGVDWGVGWGVEWAAMRGARPP
eukprot:CAMPEP_0181238982 /NCGR_PEP_ID=MMETSP1096-20121128/39667_1 /TAXON_ID=156174 ORGANISM="Chrysochromulina ericina, Strain CCMP281" /NCGR_SAMPLE_ID=MMETSP1096 /ASSEMBLY_ACC=CAM_ASM_000453 /LENGTH=53 /DNA_ID=CAMNT_0023334601 /DNA_START=380 /DNA_END=537 /DNA_ORIENTATION=+